MTDPKKLATYAAIAFGAFIAIAVVLELVRRRLGADPVSYAANKIDAVIPRGSDSITVEG